MIAFLTVLHIMVCLMLITVVLLQRGKGSDIGAALGGGASNTVFGSRGAGNFLTRLTSGCAILFMVTSLWLSYLGTQESTITIFDEEITEPFSESSADASAAAEAMGEEVSSTELEEILLPESSEAESTEAAPEPATP